MYIGLKVPVFIARFQRNLDFLDKILEKYTNIKFNENPFQWESRCSMRAEGRFADRQACGI